MSSVYPAKNDVQPKDKKSPKKSENSMEKFFKGVLDSLSWKTKSY